jgi:hypothetical protein
MALSYSIYKKIAEVIKWNEVLWDTNLEHKVQFTYAESVIEITE